MLKSQLSLKDMNPEGAGMMVRPCGLAPFNSARACRSDKAK